MQTTLYPLETGSKTLYNDKLFEFVSRTAEISAFCIRCEKNVKNGRYFDYPIFNRIKSTYYYNQVTEMVTSMIFITNTIKYIVYIHSTYPVLWQCLGTLRNFVYWRGSMCKIWILYTNFFHTLCFTFAVFHVEY